MLLDQELPNLENLLPLLAPPTGIPSTLPVTVDSIAEHRYTIESVSFPSPIATLMTKRLPRNYM